MVAEAARLAVVIEREAGVVVERLAIDRQVPSPGFRHRLHPFERRGVHEIDARTAGAGEADDPVEGELLGELGVDEVEVRPLGPPLGGEPLIIELHQFMVFGVHHHDAVVLGHFFHSQLNAPQVEPHFYPSRVRRQHVRGKDLEAGEALLDHVGNLVEHAEGQGAHKPDVK